MKFYTHPQYQAQIDDWTKWRDLYEGKHAVLKSSKYLWKHEFEANTVKGGDILRAIREERTRYTNYMKTIIRRYVSLVFKKSPDFSELKDLFGDDLQNVDGQGTSFECFIKDQLAPNFFLYGKVGAVVDSLDVDAISAADEAAKGQRPFLEMLEPMQIKDWRALSLGNKSTSAVVWLRYEYAEMAERATASVPPQMHQYCKLYEFVDGVYRVSTYRGPELGAATPSIVSDVEWALAGEPVIIPELESVPIVIAEAESWISDVSEKALQLFNLESALDNQLNFQAFQRIFAIGDFKPGDASIMNEAGITLLPVGSTVQTVEPTAPASLMNRINGVAATMFQIALNQTRVLPSDSKSVEGAETQQEAKRDLLAALISASTTLENVTNNLVKNYAAFKKKPDFAGRVKFEKDITIEDIDQLISLTSQFLDEIKQYPTWHKASLKSVAAVGNFAEIDEINEEIDKGPSTAATPQQQQQDDALKAALNGETTGA
jgi:hypothetical protein